jgi:hypothetical protein
MFGREFDSPQLHFTRRSSSEGGLPAEAFIETPADELPKTITYILFCKNGE